MPDYPFKSSNTAHSDFSNPPARRYHMPAMPSSQQMSLAEKHSTILALRQNRINTLTSLRHIERSFAALNTPDVSEPMTSAWRNYVSSNSFLTELRGLTRNYPFSSYCVDEAKRRVYADPQSNRSWNLCWLVLRKIDDDGLIDYYAQYQAGQASTWGGRMPTAEQVSQLTDAMAADWKWALDQMLRHWEEPPMQ